jgi:outer membrane lipoprotein-sorting protein
MLVLAARCAAVPPPRTPIPPEAHRLIDLLDRRWRQFVDLRTLADITIRQDGRVQRLNGVLLLQAPASLRFEALSPWGQPFVILTLNAESFTLYHVGDNQALVGPASARAIERWLGLALEPAQLVALLAGHVLPLSNPSSAELMDPDGLGPSIHLTAASGGQRIWIDPETALVRQVELTGGRAPARVTYAAEGDPGGPPSSLALTALDTGLSVSVRYRDPEVGVSLSPDLFTLSLPEHTNIHRFR